MNIKKEFLLEQLRRWRVQELGAARALLGEVIDLVERQPGQTDAEWPMEINLNAGKKCRFVQPHPLTMKLTVGLFKTGCPCCGKELWTVEELPGCLIAASRLLILEEEPEVDPLRAVIRFNRDHD